MNDSEITFWSYNKDTERLHCETIEDAIVEFLDMRQPEDVSTITLYGWKRDELTDANAETLGQIMAEAGYDWLNENWGDPDGYLEQETPKITGMIRELAREIVANYEVWSCSIVKEVEVDLQEWITKNRPEWVKK